MYSWISALLVGFTVLNASVTWLEQPTPERDLWLRDQALQVDAYLQTTDRELVRQRLERIYGYWDVQMPVVSDDAIYFVARAPGDEEGKLWRLTREVELVLDPNADGEPGVFSIADVLPSPDGQRLAIGIQERGSDWESWSVGEDRLDWIKFGTLCWAPDGQAIYYVRRPAPLPGEELCALEREVAVYRHNLGTPQAADECLYVDAIIYGIGLSPSCGEGLWMWTANGLIELDLQSLESREISSSSEDYHLVGIDQEVGYVLTGCFSPLGTIASFERSDPRRLTPLVQLDEVIVDGVLVGDHLVVSSLQDAVSRLRVFDLRGALVREIDLPGEGLVTTQWLSMGLVSHGASELFFGYSDMATPRSIYRCDVNSGYTSPFVAQGLPWDTTEYVMDRIWVGDVPVFLCRREGTSPEAPKLLYGYGGFGINLGPGFDPLHLAWMDEGGIVAVACLPGGCELGRDWHQAGRCHNKQRVFDEFFAVAEHLGGPLAIYGRSNGGLLVGAAITQRPELFDAAVAGVGCFDCLGFHEWTVGRSWCREYGSPDDPEARGWIEAYSPLHHVRPDIPPLLLVTGRWDDRVVPWHSYKFAAALQELGAPVLLHVNEFGHPPRLHRAASAQLDEDSAILAFLKRELGL